MPIPTPICHRTDGTSHTTIRRIRPHQPATFSSCPHLAELRRSGHRDVVAVGFNNPVVSSQSGSRLTLLEWELLSSPALPSPIRDGMIETARP
jgi:hypothetical protein